MKKKLLITNDDGINAPGILALYRAVKDHYDVVIAAPEKQKSGTGIGLTLHRSIGIKQVNWPDETKAWSIEGKPADCVKLGCSVLLDYKPDMIISGINHGGNSGRNIIYSGTVGGAMESVIRGIPAMAFSCVDEEDPDYEGVQKFIPGLIQHFFDHPLPRGTLANINFPNCRTESIAGVKYARQGLSYFLEKPFKCDKTQGYFISKQWDAHDEHDESDTSYLEQGFITATPIHVNEMTDLDHYNSHKELV
ncbi:MAG: 5'/3'-nucleotidase SurE [Rhabdochlamydiaceae bacterium]|nr:5'/3'-nucleotidase SurE [Candidatus Amphrikana amoebophyrae]